ncbi:MAG: hypothetical protein Q9222_002034 [Ikaeria aurantiellina]
MLSRLDFGVSADGMGDSTAKITWAISLLTILPLLYVAYIPSLLYKSTNDKPSPKQRAKQDLRFGLFSVCWALSMYPFYSKMVGYFGPSLIGNGPDQVISDSDWMTIQALCTGNVRDVSNRELIAMQFFGVAGSLYVCICALLKVMWLGLQRQHEDSKLVKLLHKHRIAVGPKMSILFLVLSPLIAISQIWTILRLRQFQAGISSNTGNMNYDNEWTFGQIAAITVFVPVLVECWFRWTKAEVLTEMPKEHKKRGRREEKKRKREQEEDISAPKRQRSDGGSEVEILLDTDQSLPGAENTPLSGPGDVPFYGLLDEEEQEYFKRADTILELNQFNDAEERELFLANVYKEAHGKELKIANSQSCSRLMERLILMSTKEQLKVLFQELSGHFLHLVQHRFASHCCETLFSQAAPFVSEEMRAPASEQTNALSKDTTPTESFFLDALKELDGNLGYLMTDPFASHTLRVLLIILSGRPLVDASTTMLLQSKKKENIKLISHDASPSNNLQSTRTVPDSFQVALIRTMNRMVAGLDTTSLRALASHPVANPLLQLLLDFEFRESGKSRAKDTESLFRKLLPDDPPAPGTESASFFDSMLYDLVGSRLAEILVTNSPGKTFKVLYQSLFRNRLPSLAKNETASYVLIKALERLNREDLEKAIQELCPQFELLVDRSRTSVIRCLVERCHIRGASTEPLVTALNHVYGQRPAERLKKMLKLGVAQSDGMSAERQKHIEGQDRGKAHDSLLAQSILEVPGPLQDFIMDSILDIDDTEVQQMAKDRNATYVLQKSLICGGDTIRYRRMIMPRLARMSTDLATDPVASHVVDTFWSGSEGLPFIREKIAERLFQHESILRESMCGRAVWRNWKMDTYKTKRYDWMIEAKGRTPETKTGIELARERYHTQMKKPKHKGRQGNTTFLQTGSNATPILSTGQG